MALLKLEWHDKKLFMRWQLSRYPDNHIYFFMNNHISLHQAARGIIQSQKYRSYCYYYGKSCLKVFLFTDVFVLDNVISRELYYRRCCDECFLGETKVERWQFNGEIVHNHWEIGHHSHFPLLLSHPCRPRSLILGGSCPSVANNPQLERPQSFNAHCHFTRIYISQPLVPQQVALDLACNGVTLCFRFSREEVANMSVLGRILFTDAVRIISLSWCTNGSSFSAATTTCKQGV